jgi:hypothetical protein
MTGSHLFSQEWRPQDLRDEDTQEETMQAVPDPSWKYGPPNERFEAFLEHRRETIMADWSVGDLLDKVPPALWTEIDTWLTTMLTEEFAEWKAGEAEYRRGD